MNILNFKIFKDISNTFIVNSGVMLEDVANIQKENWQFINQVHMADFVDIKKYEPSPPTADAIISDSFDLRIFVKTADCIPVVIADAKSGKIASIHAGWRSLTSDIVTKVLNQFDKKNLLFLKIGVGPSLGPCCSKFSDPENEIPKKYHQFINNKYVDLWAILQNNFDTFDIQNSQVEWIKKCTFCNENFFSWRRNSTKLRMGTFIEKIQKK